MTRVKDLMESRPAMIAPDATVAEAARMMKNTACGFLPVGAAGDVQGVITDRDIVTRCLAEGENPEQQLVRDCMTGTVYDCSDADSLEDAARQMNDNSVGRLVVRAEDGKICGVLTFGRIIRNNDDKRETSDIVQWATGKAA